MPTALPTSARIRSFKQRAQIHKYACRLWESKASAAEHCHEFGMGQLPELSPGPPGLHRLSTGSQVVFAELPYGGVAPTADVQQHPHAVLLASARGQE